MSIPLGARESSSINWRAAFWAGIVYTLGVFVFAFAVGMIRVTLVAPRLGPLVAVIIEVPIVLAVSWRVSLWCTRRFNVSRDARARILMGSAAFTILMLLEVGFSVLILGETVNHYFAGYSSTPGVIGLVMQGGFATLPWIQSRVRSGASRIATTESHVRPPDARL